MSIESRATVHADTREVPTYCYNCVAGPDLLTVKVTDGVATGIGPNFDGIGLHPSDGRPCVKAYGLIQKTYSEACSMEKRVSQSSSSLIFRAVTSLM